MRRTLGLSALVALLVAGVALVAVELTQGASDYGEVTLENPCAPRTAFDGSGLEGTLQQILLDGIDGAACELGTTREALVLSFVPEIGEPIEWDDATIEAAVRAGLDQSIDNAEERGALGEVRATLLREIVDRAPLSVLIDSGTSLASVFTADPDEIDPDVVGEDIRTALLFAIEAAQDAGELGTVEAFALREVVERLPVSFLVDLGLRVRDVVVDSDDPFSQEAILEAVELAMIDTIDAAEENGSIGSVPATVLRQIVSLVPLDALIDVAGRIGGLVGD